MEMRELKWCGHLLRRECLSLAEQEVPQLQGREGTVWASASLDCSACNVNDGVIHLK